MFRPSIRLALLALALLPLAARALSTAFLYQGRLAQAGAAPTGSFDFTFALYDAATDGAQVGDTVTLAGVAVANGLFAVPLDFGAVPFQGADRWLEIGVRAAGGPSYAVLAPRQPLAPTPYALFARAVNWDDILNRPATFGVYTAGPGLTLAGQQFAIADGGVATAMLAAGAVTTAKLADGAVTNAKVTDVAWGKITGAPSAYPPSGAAGGDLTGTYPNPIVGTGKITSMKILDGAVAVDDLADGAVTAVKLAADRASLAKVTDGVASAGTGSITIAPAPYAALYALEVAGETRLASYIGPGPTGTQTVDQSYTPAGNVKGVGSVIDQSFTAGRTGYLSRLTLRAGIDQGVGNATLSIFDGANNATGRLLYTQSGVNAAAGTVFTIDLAYPVPVTTGHAYCFQLAGSVALTMIYPGAYGGGTMYFGTLVMDTGSDLYFTTYVQDAAPTATPALALATRAGNVGIGTEQPAAKLDVNGTAKMTGFQLGSSATAGQVLTANASGVGTWQALPAAPTTLPPSGAAGGDLAGTYPNPTVGTGKIDSGKILDGTVAAADLADGAVTSAKIADGTIAAADLADGAVTTAKIADAGVTTARLADSAVTSAKIADAAIAAADLADGAVTSAKILDGTVAAADLAAGAVTDGKVTDVAWGKITGAPSAFPPSGTAGGDLTGSYPNPTVGAGKIDGGKILDGTVAAADLADGAVITAKLLDANVTTAKLADGAVTSAKILDATIATADLADGAVTSAKIADATVAAADLAANAVTTAKLLDANVTTAKLADGAVTSAKIADGTIAAADLADGAVTGPKILDGTVTAADLSVSSVTSAKIVDGAVTTVTIADNAVTSAKIADATVAAADLAANAVTTAKIADGAVTAAKLASDAAGLDKVSGGVMASLNGGIAIGDSPILGPVFQVTAAANTEILSVLGTLGGYYYRGGQDIWQSFTAPAATTLAAIELQVTAEGTGTATLTVYSGEGTAGAVLSTQTVTLAAGKGFFTFVLPTPVALTNNQKYTFGLSNFAPWMYVPFADEAYLGGTAWYGGGNDLVFRLFSTVGTAATPALTVDPATGYVGIDTAMPGYPLHVNGRVAGVGTYLNLSDARFKTHIRPLTAALTRIGKLQGVEFDWKRDGTRGFRFDDQHQLGFLAQEVEKVVPEAVTKGADGVYSMSYTTLIPLLVEGMKELQAENAALQAKAAEVDDLRARLATLEALVTRLAERK